MSHTETAHLRLFADSPSMVGGGQFASSDAVDGLCRAFSSVAARKLEIASGAEADDADVLWAAPLVAGERNKGRLQLRHSVGGGTSASHIAIDDACELAAAIGAVINELYATQQALKEREAELAAGVPVADFPGADIHLSSRLEAVLRSAAESIGCSAAAVYMLDAGTTELKLRAHWGLADNQFLTPGRVLRTAMADLEALAGHAVALEDAAPFADWNLPDASFRAAVCVPIASHTELLGTLWVFAPAARPFTDHEVNLVEVCAGRIASDFEREMLLVETRETSRLKQFWDDAGRRRQSRVPKIAPFVDGWDIAGWISPGDEGAAEFYDWLVDDEGSLAAAVGQIDESHFAAALGIETLRSAWRAHARHVADPGKLLTCLGDDLWAGSSEPAAAHLAGARFDVDGTMHWSAAGRTCGLILPNSALAGNADDLAVAEELPAGDAPLGIGVGTSYLSHAKRLIAGEAFVLTNSDRQLKRILAAWQTGAAARTKLRNARSYIEWLRGCLTDGVGYLAPAAMLVVRRIH